MPGPRSAPIDLTVAIYRPREGNFDHWAFCTYNKQTKEYRIYQVEGLANQLCATVLPKNPEGSDRLIKKILVGHTRESDTNKASEAIQGVQIQTEVSSWDCQEYVIDIMDSLEEVGILGSFPKYEAVKKAIKKMRGDIESTRKCWSR